MRIKKSKFLAAALSAAFLFSAAPTSLRAEEGMFMLDKIGSLPLAQKGLKISPTEIYNPAGGGLSEAVIRLSIGCTAEFVSPDGLILTNHHCAYDALVAASTPQANYGEVGFKADNRAGELPAKDYSVNITLKSEDVTAQVVNGINRDDSAAVKSRVDELQAAAQKTAGDGVTVQIQAINNGLFYYKFHYMTISDVRIAYAPPKSIGFYGGDPDNFEWTRHCGDFTFMRAYVGRDGKSAAYSKENVPYKPKKYLAVSGEGVKEDDFSMIIGYPGGTTRYRESASIAFNQDVQLPFTVEFLNAQIQALEMVGRSNPAKKVALQAEIFSLANGLKAYDGGVVAMKRANIVRQRQDEEAKLRAWVAQNSAARAKYGEALDALNAAYANYVKTGQRDLILRTMLQVAPVEFVFSALSGQADKNDLKAAIPDVLKSEPMSNREVFKFFLRRAAELPADQRIAAIENRFPNLSGEARVRAEDEFARNVFEGQGLTTEAGLNSLLNQSTDQLRGSNDQFLRLVSELGPEIAGAYGRQSQLQAVTSKNRLTYTQGIFEMRGSNPYPDANFTQRFTYGAVKGYSPKEAVSYTPFTTLDGVFEKDTGREPFNAPAKLRSLWERKDYGVHAVNGSVPLDYLTTNDIIGGNSGSPVMNARGEQVGIAFDGNYEGLGNDFFFNPALGRTIVVDIRYVMFITDKFGDAGWILRELDIKGGKANAATGGK